jgi:hypothetical protein
VEVLSSKPAARPNPNPDMADALTTFTKLINSPPGQLAAGGVLAGTVWKFFERVEAVLTDNTKLEIAVWLLGVKVGQKMEPWPETFAKVFDRVFGAKHISWRCFYRSAIASLICALLGLVHVLSILGASLFTGMPMILAFILPRWIALRILDGVAFLPHDLTQSNLLVNLCVIVPVLALANVVPDFVSLWETRLIVSLMKRTQRSVMLIWYITFDLLLTLGTAILWNLWLVSNSSRFAYLEDHAQVSFKLFAWFLIYPALFTSTWLWLYAGSGFLLKAARRFDIGFDWFNRKFDIEKKPLQSIGLVSGAIVALIYWSVVIVGRA